MTFFSLIALAGAIHPIIAVPILNLHEIGGARKRKLWLWGALWADLSCTMLIILMNGEITFNANFLTTHSFVFVTIVVFSLVSITLVHASISSEPGYAIICAGKTFIVKSFKKYKTVTVT